MERAFPHGSKSRATKFCSCGQTRCLTKPNLFLGASLTVSHRRVHTRHHTTVLAAAAYCVRASLALEMYAPSSRCACDTQFGPGAMQQHGFARNLDWSVSSTSADLQPDEKDPEVELVLTDNEYTRAMWYGLALYQQQSMALCKLFLITYQSLQCRDFSFKLVYSVSLHGEELRTAYRVINTGDKDFDFTAALHSYFEVAGIGNASVRGLKGLNYLDKVSGI